MVSYSADRIVFLVHDMLGGPISNDGSYSNLPGRFILTILVSCCSVTFFAFSVTELRAILYGQDLVLSVIDMLLLLGIASTLFSMHISAIGKYMTRSRVSFFHCLADIDGHMYTLNMHRDPSKSLATNCTAVFVVSVSIVLLHFASHYLHTQDSAKSVTVAFKAYGLFTIFVMCGLFLVLCQQLRFRIKCIGGHLNKIVDIANRRNIRSRIRDLQSLSIIHSECFRGANCLNDECGLTNVSLYALVFYILTSKSFQLFYTCSKHLDLNLDLAVTEFLEPVTLLVVTFGYLSLSTYTGEMVLKEMQLVVNNLHKFESLLEKSDSFGLFSDNTNEIEQLGHQIIHQPIAFTVLNFFQIDLRFFHLIMASVGTYLIILLQFDFNN
ncbi:uncharacterized protein LOC131207109 [Anopheles bellator]|uniref:uncharacterized protein LOC131207109 n=1 Tax=Anopheles bellator TaxID=139047 RepID=UPI0026470D8A|nr:uncharacterized protein LOC131207109 [Anopheles bellator]